MLNGIDVSEHQGIIDWNKAKDYAQFVMIRVGVGSDIASQDDSQAIRNMKECDRLGIPYGLYLYSYALNEKSEHSESQHMIRIAKQGNPTLGCYLDMEDADGYKARHNFAPQKHGKELTNFCLIFMEDMKKAGYDNVGVYANKDYFTTILDLNKIRANGKIWLAHWGVSKPSIKCDIWQYSSKGKVAGIKGDVDMNYGYFEPISKPTEYYDKPEITLIEALNDIGVTSTYEFRKKIAIANGISDYKGTKEQNMTLLALLNSGKLIKA